MSDMENMDEFELDKPIRKPQKIIRETKINPEKSLENATLVLDRKQKNLVNVYKNEKKINIAVAPSYAKYFGCDVVICYKQRKKANKERRPSSHACSSSWE